MSKKAFEINWNLTLAKMIPAGMIRLKEIVKKMKSALLPIATKFGIQEVDRFSQLQG